MDVEQPSSVGGEQGEAGLGSLSQATRYKQLSSARKILWAVGIITILANGFIMAMAETLVEKEIERQESQLRRQGLVAEDEAIEEFRSTAVASTMVTSGIGVALGIVFIILAVNVNKYPVPTTITGLVLYLGATAVYALLDPSTLTKGWFIKILVIAGLFKAIQAAIAFQKEEDRELASHMSMDTSGF